MSRKDQALLEANMPRLKAKKRLAAVEAGTLKLHHDDLFDLVYLATGSVDAANAYRVERIKEETWKPQGAGP